MPPLSPDLDRRLVARLILLRDTGRITAVPDDWAGFYFKVTNWFASTSVRRMTQAEKGTYLEMLFQQWRSPDHNLPDDPEGVIRLLAVTEIQAAEIRAAWPVVREKFVPSRHAAGRIYNTKIEETRREQRRLRIIRSNAGQVGGKASAAKRLKTELVNGQRSSTIAEANVNDRQALSQVKYSGTIVRTSPNKLVSTVSDLSHAVLRARAHSEPDPLHEHPLTEDIHQRAADLLNRYRQEWYPRYRSGAKLRIVESNMEFRDALSLVQTWDDARLEKLARIVLTTNDEWVVKTDRGFQIFATRASWADDRLRQEERHHEAETAKHQ